MAGISSRRLAKELKELKSDCPVGEYALNLDCARFKIKVFK